MRMATREITSPGESVHDLAKVLGKIPDKHLLMQRIRLSRLKLGSILERLDSFEPGPPELEQLREHSENAAFEIDTLIQAIRKMTRR